MPLFGSKRNDFSGSPPPANNVNNNNNAGYDEGRPSRGGSLFSRRHRSTSPSMTNGGGYNNRNADYTNGRGGYNDYEDNGYDNSSRPAKRTGGLFSRRRSSSTSDDAMSMGTNNSSGRHGSGGNRLHNSRFSNDPAINGARQKVSDAEEAERQADRALIEARAAVREARQHVKNLEREAEEEYVSRSCLS